MMRATINELAPVLETQDLQHRCRVERLMRPDHCMEASCLRSGSKAALAGRDRALRD